MKVGEPYKPYKLFHGAFVPNWLLCRPEVSAGAKLCFARLGQYAGQDGSCFPNIESLAEELGTSRRQADRYLSELKEHRLIGCDRPGLGRTNRYAFLWHEWAEESATDRPKRAPRRRPAPAGVSHLDTPDMSHQETPLSAHPDAPHVSHPLKENHRKRTRKETQREEGAARASAEGEAGDGARTMGAPVRSSGAALLEAGTPASSSRSPEQDLFAAVFSKGEGAPDPLSQFLKEREASRQQREREEWEAYEQRLRDGGASADVIHKMREARGMSGFSSQKAVVGRFVAGLSRGRNGGPGAE